MWPPTQVAVTSSISATPPALRHVTHTALNTEIPAAPSRSPARAALSPPRSGKTATTGYAIPRPPAPCPLFDIYPECPPHIYGASKWNLLNCTRTQNFISYGTRYTTKDPSFHTWGAAPGPKFANYGENGGQWFSKIPNLMSGAPPPASSGNRTCCSVESFILKPMFLEHLDLTGIYHIYIMSCNYL